MKILLINNCHFPRGGSETVYFNTGKALEEAGHQVLYFSFKDDNNIPCSEAEYFPLRNKRNPLKYIIDYFYNRSAARALEKLIKENGVPDIADINLIWGGMTASICRVLKKYSVPIVHTVHDYRMICPAYTFKRPNGNICEKCYGGKFYHCVINKCCKDNSLKSLMMASEMYFRNTFHHPAKLFDGFIYVSRFNMNKHIEFNPEFSRKLSTIIYNTSDLKSSNINRSDDYLLYYGRLSFEKGILTLLKAIKNYPGLKLKIVGKGPLESDIRQFLYINKIDNVELLGFKTGQELQELIENSSFVVVPSEWYENNPLTIVEPYTLGKPVIGADIGGITEIIDDGNTGYLFEAFDVESLIQVLSKIQQLPTEEYSRLCTNAAKFAAKHFNKSTYAERLVAFFDKVINSIQ